MKEEQEPRNIEELYIATRRIMDERNIAAAVVAMEAELEEGGTNYMNMKLTST